MSLGYEKAAEIGRSPDRAYSLGDVVQVMGQSAARNGERDRRETELGRPRVRCAAGRGSPACRGCAGVGKTMLAKALGRSIACSVRRVQFTPDLLPSDITGVSVFNQETRDFEFKPGGIFANIVVGDEINRASPKTNRPFGVDGGTSSQRRRHDLSARVALYGGRHPEPDRDGRHLPAA